MIALTSEAWAEIIKTLKLSLCELEYYDPNNISAMSSPSAIKAVLRKHGEGEWVEWFETSGS